jgi:hypothetical protein
MTLNPLIVHALARQRTADLHAKLAANRVAVESRPKGAAATPVAHSQLTQSARRDPVPMEAPER